MQEETINEEENYSIGNSEERKRLEPKPVRIYSYKKEEPQGKYKPKIVFMCQHPDQENLIPISKVRYEKENQLVIQGTWLSLDKNNQLSSKSTLAYLLRYLKCKSLNDTVGKTVETTSNEQGYLVIRAYK